MLATRQDLSQLLMRRYPLGALLELDAARSVAALSV
jgi:hypothetical protein